MTSDPFDTLGLAPVFDLDLAAAERRYRELSKVVHPDRFAAVSGPERRRALGKAVDVNEAWRRLRDPITRAESLLRRLGVVFSETNQPKPSQAMLMDFLELREQLSDARLQHDHTATARLADEVKGREGEVLARLSAGFARLSALEGEVRAQAGQGLLETLGELRYVRRFLDEVKAIEDDHGATG